MNLLRLALGLIQEAAGTPAGQEVINNIRSSVRRDTADGQPSPDVDVERLLAEHRAQVNRSLEMVVHAVNEQHQRLAATMRRQRIWNFALAGGLVLALIAAVMAAR